MTRQQPNGSEGIRNPKVFDTEAEAAAHARWVADLEEALLAMTPAERAEWFQFNSGSRLEDLE